METSITAVLADFAARRAAEVATAKRDIVARALVDTVAVGIAGRRTDEVVVLRQWTDGERARGHATSWLDGARVSAATAALENAFAAHVLDYDDVSPATRMHPSVVLVPALLATAECIEVSGPDLVHAYDVGASVFRAVASVLPADIHYRSGWHTTATVGLIAATCAVSALRGLPVENTRNALGFCGSLASGSIRNFGTMAKAFQVARAASDAVMASELAGLGFTSNAHQFDVPDGFFGMYGKYDQARLASLADQLVDWSQRWIEDFAIKLYPSCYATHNMLDATRDLVAAGLQPGDIDRIDVTVEPNGLDPLIRHFPEAGLQGKFSAGLVLGLMLCDRTVTLASFDDKDIYRSELADLYRRVTLHESASPPVGAAAWSQNYAVIEVGLRDGSTRSARRDRAHGHASDPLSDEELGAKFADCLHVGGIDEGTVPLSCALQDLCDAPAVAMAMSTLRGAMANVDKSVATDGVA